MEIEIIYDSTYNAKLDEVTFTTTNGTINVVDGLPGDVNSDGEVNLADTLLFRRYVADWDVTIQ